MSGHRLAAAGLAACTAAVAAIAVGPAAAQYKVVGPDGSVTYTDRPPAVGNARITNIGKSGAPQPPPPEANLPYELRQASQRYPVVLYVGNDCVPCESARVFLQQRGIPFSERRVVSEEDAAALERAVGVRTVPSLTIGQQGLRGLSQPEWTSFLDAAGYPRESRLPRSYAQAPAASAAAARPPASSTSPGTPASNIVPAQPPSTAPGSAPAQPAAQSQGAAATQPPAIAPGAAPAASTAADGSFRF